jgi:lipoate-protein ligase A
VAWPVARLAGSAAELHARPLADPAVRVVWVLEARRPALVLGSTQADGVVDAAACRAQGVEVVRRHSGGGAVLVVPGELCWVDVVIPRADVLWDDDVGRSARWLARTWVGALADLGVVAEAHAGPMARPPWSDLVCFAGRAPGEVVAAGGKVVGVAQRRTRWWARFQCAVLRRWDPVPLLALLDLDPRERARGAAELAGAATGIDRDPADVAAAFVAHLP